MGCSESFHWPHVDIYTTDADTMIYVTCVDTNTFSEWFKRELLRREWSQADFAKRSKLAPSTVSAWATGDRTPDPESCDLIADVMLVDRDRVLALAGHRSLDRPLAPDDLRIDVIAAIRLLDPDDPTTRFWLESLPPTIEKLKKLDRTKRRSQ